MTTPDPDTTQGIVHYLPFWALATARAGQHIHRPITTRVIEGVIMGAVGGAFGVYVSVQVMQNDIKNLSAAVTAVAEQANQARVENTRRIERLEDIYFK